MKRMLKENKLEGDIFFSYSRKDRNKVDWIARQLKAGGFQIWIDRHDIPGGIEWSDSITTAIKNAEAFILILSPNSIESLEVKKELNTAIQNRIRIIPVILHPIDLNWLIKYKINEFQNIVYYRRRQVCIVDLINSLGGLRGVASLMPNNSTIAMRENTQLIAELLRIIQEVSFSAAFLIFNGGEDWQYYIQFQGSRDSPKIRVEAVGNVNLDANDQLNEKSMASLLELGWQKPNKNSTGNYWREWQIHTNRDRAAVSINVMTTFLKIYRHYRGENLILSKIDLG